MNIFIILITLGALIATFFGVYAFLSRDSLLGKSYKTQDVFIDGSDVNRRLTWNSTVDFLKNGTMVVTSDGTAQNGKFHQKVIQYGKYGRPRHGNIDFILSSKYIVYTDDQKQGFFGVKHSIKSSYETRQRGLSKILSIDGSGKNLTLTQQNLKNDHKKKINLIDIGQNKKEQKLTYGERVNQIKQKSETRSIDSLKKLNKKELGSVLALSIGRVNRSKLDDLSSGNFINKIANNPKLIKSVTIAKDAKHNVTRIGYNHISAIAVRQNGERLELFAYNNDKLVEIGQTKLSAIYQIMFGFDDISGNMRGTYDQIKKKIIVKENVNLNTFIN